jgi:choline dehydrogenase
VNDDPSSYWWPYSSSNIDNMPDEHLIRFMKEKAFALYHPIGTARMGPSPSASVVNMQCQVRGVKSLRIVDASVFPEQLSAHPTAAIGAMACKIGDIIKKNRVTDTPVRGNL